MISPDQQCRCLPPCNDWSIANPILGCLFKFHTSSEGWWVHGYGYGSTIPFQSIQPGVWHVTQQSHFDIRATCVVTCDKQNFNQNFDRFFSWRGIQHLFPGCQWVLDILLMIVVSRVDENKFLNNDKKIFLLILKLFFFFEPFLTCDQSQCDVWHWPKLGPDHRPCGMWLEESIEMVQYILVPMQNPYCRVWVPCGYGYGSG